VGDADGVPRWVQKALQTMAPTSAAIQMPRSTVAGSTMPFPMVRATLVVRKAPTILKNQARTMACEAVRARVETEVAMALAASFMPL